MSLLGAPPPPAVRHWVCRDKGCWGTFWVAVGRSLPAAAAATEGKSSDSLSPRRNAGSRKPPLLCSCWEDACRPPLPLTLPLPSIRGPLGEYRSSPGEAPPAASGCRTFTSCSKKQSKHQLPRNPLLFLLLLPQLHVTANAATAA